MNYREITEPQARAILQILKEECGASDDESFVIHVTTVENDHACSEYRFCGALGFGGKFRNNGNNDNMPYVDCYREHETPKRRLMMNNANVRIANLFRDEQSAPPSDPGIASHEPSCRCAHCWSIREARKLVKGEQDVNTK